MTYMGYTVVKDGDHIKVTAPDGTEWTEDTYSDATREIREAWMLKAVNKPIDRTFDDVL